MDFPNITFQFDDYFVTYDAQAEAWAIAEVEEKGEYVAAFGVTNEQREIINMQGSSVSVAEDELIAEPPQVDLMIPLSNQEAERLGKVL